MGGRCRTATIKDLAEELNLDWDTVKTVEKQDMRAQLAKARTPGPQVIGIDEISIRKDHTYHIVVSDLISRRENLTLEGHQSLKTLPAANKRLRTAYLPNESFGQLWNYRHEGCARRFFKN